MKKNLITTFSLFLFLFSSSFSASAHVMVKPSTAGIATIQTFDIEVPTEKDIATVGIKILIPPGISDVIPNVKPGWTVNVIKNGDTVTEIDWSDGSIPSGQRDDFYFNAQVPPHTTTIIWKIYQTYEDGSVVSWDMNPQKIKNGEDQTPYVTTKVINDLQTTPVANQGESQKANLSIIFSIVGIIIACVALSIARRKTFPQAQPRRRKKSRSYLKK